MRSLLRSAALVAVVMFFQAEHCFATFIGLGQAGNYVLFDVSNTQWQMNNAVINNSSSRRSDAGTRALVFPQHLDHQVAQRRLGRNNLGAEFARAIRQHAVWLGRCPRGHHRHR